MAPYHGGPPGSLCLHLCRVEQGWRPPPLAKMLQVMTAQESTRAKHYRAVVRWTLRRVHKYSAPYGEAYRGAIGVLSVGNGAIVGECRRILAVVADLVVVVTVR